VSGRFSSAQGGFAVGPSFARIPRAELKFGPTYAREHTRIPPFVPTIPRRLELIYEDLR
jgi:hypothetical protein